MPCLGVIFDFDGVIANTEPLHLQAFQDVLDQTPMSLSKEAYESTYLGYDDIGVFTQLAQDQDIVVSSDETSELLARKGTRYTQLVESHDVIFPEARTCIERLSGTCELGIASGALHQEIETILRASSLRSYFTAIVAADDVKQSKPEPDTYRLAIELLCLAMGRPPSPAGFVAIEDSLWGIQSAHAAGLPCIAVTTTYTADRLTVANQIVPSLADIDTTALEALVHNSQARREQP